MKFRPCIDIHNGKVKQIVGGSLKDQGDQAAENFVSEQDAAFYAELYKKAGLKGGHVILLNGKDSPNYEGTSCPEKIPRRTSDRRRDLPGECGGVSGGWCQPRDRNFLRIQKRSDILGKSGEDPGCSRKRTSCTGLKLPQKRR